VRSQNPQRPSRSASVVVLDGGSFIVAVILRDLRGGRDRHPSLAERVPPRHLPFLAAAPTAVGNDGRRRCGRELIVDRVVPVVADVPARRLVRL
jgi:hypothetical protein